MWRADPLACVSLSIASQLWNPTFAAKAAAKMERQLRAKS
jgi:hypothetical protein